MKIRKIGNALVDVEKVTGVIQGSVLEKGMDSPRIYCYVVTSDGHKFSVDASISDFESAFLTAGL